MIYLGVDPGKSGAIAAITSNRDVLGWIKLCETEHDVAAWLRSISERAECVAALEKVHSMPRQGVSSTFKFGMSYGFVRGLLVANRVPFTDVTPSKWQGDMKCRTKGDKNVTKSAAQQMFPKKAKKITHAVADALLIAEWSRRTTI